MITNSESVIFGGAALIALLSGQIFLFLLILGFLLVWEDAKWPAFDSDDFDNKMRKGPLNPWKKGN